MNSTSAPMADAAREEAALPEWVVFSCDGERFAVPLLMSREVVPPQAFTRLPGCGSDVIGLMGLRGRIVTVFDLGVVLGLGSTQRQADYRVLVLDHGERVVAVAVDAIAGIAREEAARLEALAPDLGRLQPIRADMLGRGTLEGGTYHALDLNRILSRLLV